MDIWNKKEKKWFSEGVKMVNNIESKETTKDMVHVGQCPNCERIFNSAIDKIRLHRTEKEGL